MDNEIVKEFVRKRTFYRKLSFYNVGIIAIIAILISYFDKIGVVYYGNLYIFIIVALSFTLFLLHSYIGRTLSICPICNTLILTMSPSLSHKKWRTGNGPLPDRCPYCNTDFSKYKEPIS